MLPMLLRTQKPIILATGLLELGACDLTFKLLLTSLSRSAYDSRNQYKADAGFLCGEALFCDGHVHPLLWYVLGSTTRCLLQNAEAFWDLLRSHNCWCSLNTYGSR